MKFVLFASLFLVILATVFGTSPPQPDNAHGIIQRLIGQYEARFHGPSIVHPEERADVIDSYNLHI
ncbi:uncharacterized protein [Musca autumnalis]|uniref:uncharacterized protein n=1 Tax=Musca autumnalis TaxID=221902 RepID=UPI003CEDE437